MIPIDVREQKADGDRDALRRVLRQPRLDLLRQLLKRRILQRDQDAAVEVEAFRQSQAVSALDQGLRLSPLQREVVFPIHPLDIGDVLETPRRDVDDVRALALQKRVRGDRRADAQGRDRFPGYAAAFDRVHHRLRGSPRRRGGLRDHELIRRLIDTDQIGKGAPGIDTDADCHTVLLHGSLRQGPLSVICHDMARRPVSAARQTARRKMSSSVAVRGSSSPAIRPLRITRTRLLSDRISGISEEISRQATPSRASAATSW